MTCNSRHKYEVIEQIIKQRASVYAITVSCLNCSNKIDVKYKYNKITTSGEVSAKTKQVIRKHLRKERQRMRLLNQ